MSHVYALGGGGGGSEGGQLSSVYAPRARGRSGAKGGVGEVEDGSTKKNTPEGTR